MSTLVEAVSVVIPRHVLDVSYPGGCDAYLEGARRTRGVRFVVADARLTSVSLATLDEATAFVRPLEAIGLTTPDGRPLAIACVDEHFGPTAPAPWLRWRRHDEGYTSCWLEWTEPGELALPDVRLDAAGAAASTNGASGAMGGSAPEPFDPFADAADASTDEVLADEILGGDVPADAVSAGDVGAEDVYAADVGAAGVDATDIDLDGVDAAFDSAPVSLVVAVDIGVTEATEPEAHPPENDPEPDEEALASDPIPA
ncbi:MAG TPA: hypothetical protein VFX39_05770, partial [Gemmatimonadaceae bacterium]|nr:hypothetical protein [Gemmatimonadaceae bacterium]